MPLLNKAELKLSPQHCPNHIKWKVVNDKKNYLTKTAKDNNIYQPDILLRFVWQSADRPILYFKVSQV